MFLLILLSIKVIYFLGFSLVLPSFSQVFSISVPNLWFWMILSFKRSISQNCSCLLVLLIVYSSCLVGVVAISCFWRIRFKNFYFVIYWVVFKIIKKENIILMVKMPLLRDEKTWMSRKINWRKQMEEEGNLIFFSQLHCSRSGTLDT